jgi:DNA-binding response OmpR family regulator
MARATESDKVLGLESGADDYLAKPLDARELRARVSAILRRQDRFDPPEEDAPPRLIESHDLTLDAARRRAAIHGEPVVLTRREFDLLHVLAARPGIVFSRAALLSRVWSDGACATERSVDTVLSRLRRKIERAPHSPKLILTEWGVGYKFADVE